MRCRPEELIDHFIMKIRMVRFLRTPEFDTLFSGDPIWATEVIGGMGLDGRTLVTKNSFRYLHTLHTMGPAPEPNLTILWSEKLPIAFKKYAAQVSIVTSLAAIRERRSDAHRLQQRRLRHCLLRQPDGDRQADAVLRRTRQPCENAAVRNQRRGG